MALLSKRQQTAAALARELGEMAGCWVTSPLPLDDGQRLRVQVLDTERIYFVQAVRDLGLGEPVFVSILPRVTFTGMLGACLYEIDLPRERQQIIDDRIRGEIATKEKTPYEVEQVKRYLGLTGPKK